MPRSISRACRSDPDAALLRASHIIPWAECESDAERLDVHNGLLLSALWDAAFDKGLISFADDGTPLPSPKLSAQARAALNLDHAPRLAGLRDAHLLRLRRHRLSNGFLF
jgi:putative restriction endonuclease